MNAATARALARRPVCARDLGCAVRDVADWTQRWLASRWRAAEDRDTLAAMSERELRDIGLTRGNVDAVATGAWRFDRA